MKDNGKDFAIIRTWHSYGKVDDSGIQSIKNARSAGISYVDAYLFPCRSKRADVQVADMIAALDKAKEETESPFLNRNL